jgi:hypothetical protein
MAEEFIDGDTQLWEITAGLSDGTKTISVAGVNSSVANVVGTVGGVQGDSPLTGAINYLAVNQGVFTLPPAVIGKSLYINYSGGGTTTVYPAVGDDLGNGVDQPTILMPQSIFTIICYAEGLWRTIGPVMFSDMSIGTWNMETTADLDVTFFGTPQKNRVTKVSCTIFDIDGNPNDLQSGGHIVQVASSINLASDVSPGIFDNANYAAATGIVTLEYTLV